MFCHENELPHIDLESFISTIAKLDLSQPPC
jgi:hypothetical protein